MLSNNAPAHQAAEKPRLTLVLKCLELISAVLPLGALGLQQEETNQRITLQAEGEVKKEQESQWCLKWGYIS